MIILRPSMNDEQRDVELAKFEAFLKNQNVQHIKANVRGKQRLAYPIKRCALQPCSRCSDTRVGQAGTWELT